METFPSIKPTYAIAKDTAPLSTSTALGDGYKKRISFGLNTIKPAWTIEWILSLAEASSVDLFLKNRSADGEWFYWAPPDQSVALKWRCDEWTLEHTAENLVKLSASFRQVLELEYFNLTAATAECNDDDLCYVYPLSGGAKILIIGNPYYALDIADPTAVIYNPTQDIIGCQTVLYTSAGMLIQSGGVLTRSEVAGSTDRFAYSEVALYDLDGVFIRRFAYQRVYSGTYFYSFEAPYMSTVMLDNKILVDMLSYNVQHEFFVAELDGTSVTRLAFSSGSSKFTQDMRVNPLSGRVYINTFAFDWGEVSMIQANRTAGWSYRYTAVSGSQYFRPYALDTGDIGGVERTFVAGYVVNTTNPQGGGADSRNGLLIVNASAAVVSSWRYKNITVYQNAAGYVYQGFYGICQDSDGSLLVAGVGTIEIITIGDFYSETDSEGATLTRIDPATGDVIKSVGILFVNDFEYYGYSYFSHSTVAVDSDGTIYYAFGGYVGDDYYTGGFLIQLNSDLEVTGGLYIKSKFANMDTCGLTITPDEILIPGILDGVWAGPNAGNWNPQDGVTLVLNKIDLGNASAEGPYWVTGAAGTPAFEIFDITGQLDTMPLTLEKESMTVTVSNRGFSAATPSAAVTASTKAPATVVLTRQ